MSILLGPNRGVSCKYFIPWNGAPIFDLDLDPEIPVVPFGKLPLSIGLNVPVIGTIDPRYTGKFGARIKARLVGGGNGWDKETIGLHISNPSGTLLTAAVLAVVGAEVGEVVVDATPLPIGTDYVISAGPASRVLADRAWHVDLTTGVTMVAPRIPVPTDPTTIEVLLYDPTTSVAEVASDMILQPGMILVDPIRIGLPIMIVEVSGEFNAEGSRATCKCVPVTDYPKPGKGAARLVAAIQSAAREASPPEYLQITRYRVVAENPATKKRTLQAVDFLGNLPNLIEIGTATLPGFSAKVVPGSEVLVGFMNGDAKYPIVLAFQEGIPALQLQFEALSIVLGEGLGGPIALATGVQTQITALEAQVAALTAWVAAVTALAATPPTSVSFTLFGLAMAAPGATVAGLVASQIPVIAAAVVPATSLIVTSD